MPSDLDVLLQKQLDAQYKLDEYRKGERPILSRYMQSERDICEYVLSQLHEGASFGFMAKCLYPSAELHNAGRMLAQRLSSYFGELPYRMGE